MDRPIRDDEGSSPAINITSLPQDLLIAIIGHDCMERNDVVAIRLACIILSKAATVVLFRRVRISQLCRDRDAFLSICKSPHLAQHVRDVEWQEICWFPGYFAFASQMAQCPDNLPSLNDDDEHQFCDNLDIIAADLFWLPVVPHGQEIIDKTAIESQREDAIQAFYNEFQQAIRQLPSLSTVISRPMPAYRTLDWCEYPINVRVFQTHHPYVDAEDRTWLPQTNDGLFLFLLPAIQSLAPSITRLVWEDDFMAASYFREPRPEAFKHLHTLLLTLTPQQFGPYDNLAASLEAATSVRNLSIGVREGPTDVELERALVKLSLETRETGWSRLHSLSLDSMRKSMKALVDVVTHNADTLRHLHLSNCCFQLGRLKQLADIPNLQLHSFSIYDFEPADDVTTEKTLLAFVNKKPEINGNYRLFCRESTHANSRTIMTVSPTKYPEHDHTVEPTEDQGSDIESLDSLSHRLNTAPKWVWGRYFKESSCSDSYCYQVPDSNPYGIPTTCWKFTSRDGTVAFGADPLFFFEEWDLEAGDMEQPTPYCNQLREFNMETCGMCLGSVLGEGSTAWDLIKHLEPPEDAIRYDEHEAEIAISSLESCEG